MNKQSYLYITSLIVSIGLWFTLLVSPYIDLKQTLETKIIADQDQLNDFEETINMLPQNLAELKDLKAKKNSLNSTLFTKEEVIKLFEKLKKTANDQQLFVTEITPPIEELLRLNSLIPDSNNPQFLNIGVRVSGSYIEFAKFIKMIESESYFRGINACSILGSKDYNKELDLYVTFKALLGHTGDQS